MANPTPNRGYNRPAEGTLDWHVPLNENAAMLDEDVQKALDMAESALDSSSRRVVTPDEDLQAALDDNDAVHLVGGEVYTPGSTVTIPERTVVWAPDSIVEVGGDYDGVSVRNRAKIYGRLSVNTDSVDDYTSRAVALDTREAGSYGYPQPRSETIVNVDVRGNTNPGSVGVDFYADGQGIYNVTGSIRFEQFDTAVRLATPNSGHINGNFLYLMGEDSRKIVHHTGSGPARSAFRGSLHVGPPTERVFFNDTRNHSFSFDGHVWDVNTGNLNGQSVVKGTHMKIAIPDGEMADRLWKTGVTSEANADSDSFGTTISAIGRDGIYIYNVNKENMVRLGPTWTTEHGNVFSMDYGGLDGETSTQFVIDENGNLKLGGSVSEGVDL
jgi:hypothetical protein